MRAQELNLSIPALGLPRKSRNDPLQAAQRCNPDVRYTKGQEHAAEDCSGLLLLSTSSSDSPTESEEPQVLPSAYVSVHFQRAAVAVYTLNVQTTA